MTTAGESDAFARYRASRPAPRTGGLGANALIAVLGIAACVVWGFAAPRLVGGKKFGFKAHRLDTFPDGVLTIVQLDVGQGDGIFIHTPGGKNVMIDCGEGENPDNQQSRQYPATKEVVEPFLATHGVYNLDLLILTHPHSDHGGGMGPLIDWLYENGGSVKCFIDPGFAVPSRFYKEILEAVDRHNVKYMPVIDASQDKPAEYKEFGGTLIGRDPLGDPSVAFQIFAPFHKIGNPNGQEANENSVVTRIQCGEISLLSPGDASEREEDEVAAFWGPRLKSMIYFPAHHGSHTSIQPNWLKMINPEYISTSSYPPVFGHPAADAIKSWKTYITPPPRIFLRTDMNGDIWYRTDGNKLAIRTQFPVKSEAEQWEPGHRGEWNMYREFKANEPTTWGECVPVPGTDEL